MNIPLPPDCPYYLISRASLSTTSVLKKGRAGAGAGNMTGLLDRMERDKLLKRRSDPEDRRASRICLTKLGIDAEKASMAAVEMLLEKVFADIPQKDIMTTKNVLRKVLFNCSREDI